MAKGTLTGPQNVNAAVATGKLSSPEKENKAALVIPRHHEKATEADKARDQQAFDRGVKERLENVERSVSKLPTNLDTAVTRLNRFLGGTDNSVTEGDGSQNAAVQEVFYDKQPNISYPAISYRDAGIAAYPTLKIRSVNKP